MYDIAFFCNSPANIDRVYAAGRREEVAEFGRLHPEIVTAETIEAQLPTLREVEALFSTWGMFAPTETHLDALPALKAVFYGAGTVKSFAGPFLERGITVVSAWAANAVPVAEFTLAQILLANKGCFRNIQDCGSPDTRPQAFRGEGNFGQTVALLGAGMIGRKVIELLQPFALNIVVFDPFLSEEKAAEFGVEKVELGEAFARGEVVSNHLANVPETRGMLKREHFAAMKPNAFFLNTGRGATLVEQDLADVLAERPDLYALLDVTDPEPPQPDSPFYRLPNLLLTSHIAGSLGTEVVRMADYVIAEYRAWRAGEPLRYAVTKEMLATMA